MIVHFVGIGGSGASAVAAIAQNQGYGVTGCDVKPHNEFTQAFKPNQLFTGHCPDHLRGVDILAVTPAIFSLDPGNPELVAAKDKNIKTMTWQKFMGRYLEKDKFVIAVCGTHGKSTTTAMIAKVLEDAGLDPTVELGAIVPDWQRNYRVGQSRYFVTEADEFNDNFLVTHPDIALVTTIEMDHPEYFKDFEAVKNSFHKFLSSTKQLIIANLEDPVVAETVGLIMKHSGVSCIDYTKHDLTIELKVPGEHMLKNAKAAFQVGLALGIEPAAILNSLRSFPGIGRRFEHLGQLNGAQVITDFGHHPTEVRVTVQAARGRFPHNRILVIFQPHLFSRTKVLFDDFVQTFRQLPADRVIITDIYASRENDTGLISSKQLVEAVNQPTVSYLKEFKDIQEYLLKGVKPNDVVLFMGAGDIDNLARQLAE